MDEACSIHPWCDRNNGQECVACGKVKNQVKKARHRDAKRGMVCTMTFNYINSMQNTPCMYCGTVVRTLVDLNHHPDGLSPNRVNNSKPHDCDPAQTRVCCHQCNLFQHSNDFESTLNRYISMVTWGELQYQYNDAIVPVWPFGFDRDSRPKEQALIRSLHTHAKKKRHDASAIGHDWFEEQYRHVQHGMCGCCGLQMVTRNQNGSLCIDVSFDRIDSAVKHYSPENTVLMHRACNVGKSVWPIEQLRSKAALTVARHSNR